MLVLCVGMYRACSTWQYGVASAILERHRAGIRLGFVDGGPFGSDVEPGLDPSAWHVLKAHDAHDRFASALAEGRALALYAYRDLRDVACSWAHKTGAGLDEVLSGGFLDLCLRNDRFWRAQPGTLVQSYEALIDDPARGVAEIAAHLGVDLAEGEAREIAEAHSVEANRRRTDEISGRIRADGREPSPRDQDSYDRASLLHWNHLRDGRAGGWRGLATPAQKAGLARACGAWLVENGYEADGAWADPNDPRSDAVPRISFAQNMEDILLDRLFRGRKGTFVDVGANHPTHNNNTYFFYLRGWRGVNLEPVPAARSLFDDRRPGDLNLSVAVSDVLGDLPFYEIPDCTGLSSLSPEVAEEQRARGFRVVEHRVPTRTVAALVDQYRLEPPEIFSLDVEGNEERVLRSIPLAEWKPQVFVIEATRPMTNIPCHHGWEPILLEHGYLFAAFDGINRFYLRGDLADALPLFDCPVNSLDFYERFDVHEQRSKADAIARQRDQERAAAEEKHAYLERELAHFRQESEHFRREEAHYRQEAARQLMARAEDRIASASEMARERDAWQRERDAWQAERDSIQRERDGWQVERDSVQRERDARQVERDSVQVERDSVQRERDAWQRERDEVHRERREAHRERDAWQAERDAWNRERDEHRAAQAAWLSERIEGQAERAGLRAELDRAERNAEDLVAEVDRLRHALEAEEAQAREARRALQAEREAVERERARWLAERTDRDRQAAEAETLLRPYRLIDRLGVVSAIHRRATRPRKSNTP